MASSMRQSEGDQRCLCWWFWSDLGKGHVYRVNMCKTSESNQIWLVASWTKLVEHSSWHILCVCPLHFVIWELSKFRRMVQCPKHDKNILIILPQYQKLRTSSLRYESRRSIWESHTSGSAADIKWSLKPTSQHSQLRCTIT
jgi:hypothetical protein